MRAEEDTFERLFWELLCVNMFLCGCICGGRCAGWSVFTSWTICGDGLPISQVAGSDGYLLWVKNTLFILELAAFQACQDSSHTIVTLGLYVRNYGLFQNLFFLL